MTRDEIKNTPELVDYLLDESVTEDSRKKLHKRMEEICNLAIQALEQEQKARKRAEINNTKMNDLIRRQDVLDEIIRFSTGDGASVECQQLYCNVNNIPSVIPLSKGHGKLIVIDLSQLLTITDISADGSEFTYVPYSEIEDAPTIIDADRTESEE